MWCDGQRFHRGLRRQRKRSCGIAGSGRVAEGDWTGFWQAVIVDLFSGCPAWWIRPADRRRSRLALRLAEREVISRGVTAHRSARSIAKLLGRSPSTVSPEISRNGGYSRYRATLADDNAWARSLRPKRCKLANHRRLRRAVAGKLRSDWSPEQIAGWLKRRHPDDEHSQESHETIHRSLFVQARGVLKKELLDIFDQDVRCVVQAG